MHKKIIITFCFYLISTLSVSVYADAYVSARFVAGLSEVGDFSSSGLAGNTPQDDEIDDAIAGFGGSVGYAWNNLRTELEYIWRYRFDLDNRFGTNPNITGLKSDVDTQSVTANILWDFHNNSRFTPYVGAGLGWVHHDADSTLSSNAIGNQSNDTTSTDLVWLLIGGINYKFNERWVIDASYRYSDLGEIEIDRFPSGGVINTGDYTSHDFSIGVVYSF